MKPRSYYKLSVHLDLTLPKMSLALLMILLVPLYSSSRIAVTPSSSSRMDLSSSRDATISVRDDPGTLPSKKRRFNCDWTKGRAWLKHDTDNNVMFCEWCRSFDKSEYRNQFVKGCASMKLESIKKHELSAQHKHSEAVQRTHARPDRAPMQLALKTMEQEKLEQMKCLFNTAFYLVVAERPFRDFSALLQLQTLNGVAVGRSYNSPQQARQFVHFISEHIRKDLVDLLHITDFFSVCMDSSTDKATIDEEMVQVRVLQDNLPVYKFVAVKALSKADAAGTVSAVVSALETECERNDWQSKLVGLSADGAAVNMGVRTGAAVRLQEKVPHLIPIHCYAHRVELHVAIKGISTNVAFFKSLEDTLVELYKLYHKSPLCWSELQQVGQMLQMCAQTCETRRYQVDSSQGTCS